MASPFGQHRSYPRPGSPRAVPVAFSPLPGGPSRIPKIALHTYSRFLPGRRPDTDLDETAAPSLPPSPQPVAHNRRDHRDGGRGPVPSAPPPEPDHAQEADCQRRWKQPGCRDGPAARTTVAPNTNAER
jgi:hypothetical protein